MGRIRSCWGLTLVAAVIGLGGCSGAPSSSPPLSISLTSSAQGVDQSLPTDALALLIKATVTNDTSSKGVTWSLNGPGSIGISPNTSVTYNSPTTYVASPELATVTATSVADPTKSASIQISVNPDPSIPFYQALTAGTVGVPYSAPWFWMAARLRFNGASITGRSRQDTQWAAVFRMG